jgi:hypothetical protein
LPSAANWSGCGTKRWRPSTRCSDCAIWPCGPRRATQRGCVPPPCRGGRGASARARHVGTGEGPRAPRRRLQQAVCARHAPRALQHPTRTCCCLQWFSIVRMTGWGEASNACRPMALTQSWKLTTDVSVPPCVTACVCACVCVCVSCWRWRWRWCACACVCARWCVWVCVCHTAAHPRGPRGPLARQTDTHTHTHTRRGICCCVRGSCAAALPQLRPLPARQRLTGSTSPSYTSSSITRQPCFRHSSMVAVPAVLVSWLPSR